MLELQQTIRIVNGPEGTAGMVYKFDHPPVALTIICHLCGCAWAQMIPSEYSGWTGITHACEACGGGNLANLMLEYRDFTVPDELLFRELDMYYSRGRKLPYSGSVYA